MKINLGKLSFPATLLIMLAVWTSLFLIPIPAHVELTGDFGYLSLADKDLSAVVYIVDADTWDSYPEQYYSPADFAAGYVTEQPVKLAYDVQVKPFNTSAFSAIQLVYRFQDRVYHPRAAVGLPCAVGGRHVS